MQSIRQVKFLRNVVLIVVKNIDRIGENMHNHGELIIKGSKVKRIKGVQYLLLTDCTITILLFVMTLSSKGNFLHEWEFNTSIIIIIWMITLTYSLTIDEFVLYGNGFFLGKRTIGEIISKKKRFYCFKDIIDWECLPPNVVFNYGRCKIIFPKKKITIHQLYLGDEYYSMLVEQLEKNVK